MPSVLSKVPDGLFSESTVIGLAPNQVLNTILGRALAWIELNHRRSQVRLASRALRLGLARELRSNSSPGQVFMKSSRAQTFGSQAGSARLPCQLLIKILLVKLYVNTDKRCSINQSENAMFVCYHLCYLPAAHGKKQLITNSYKQ